MNISPTQNALNLITNAQNKATEAAEKIATFPVRNDEVGSPDYKSEDLIKPILSLNEAELETSAGVKLLKTENKMLGSLLDTRA
ncbi:MAG: hypothetical protein ACU83N_13725 [Gammaproteobacteria bacterium]